MARNCIGVIHTGSSGAIARFGLAIADRIVNVSGTECVLFTSEPVIVAAAEAKGVPYRAVNSHAFASGSFRDKVDAARAELGKLLPATVYAGSMASSAWALAGRQLGVKVVLHAHEFERELVALLHSGATCIDVCAAADLIIVSGETVVSSLRRCVGYVPDQVVDVGPVLDGADIAEYAKQEVRPRWLYGKAYVRSARSLIAMWGVASEQNGVDVFVEMARLLPESDFLWIGAWTEHANRVLAGRGLTLESLHNFYCTGEIDNPYPLILMCDLLALTAREVESSANLIELAALETQIVCFSDSFGSSAVLPSKFCILHGTPTGERFVKFIRLILRQDKVARQVISCTGPVIETKAGVARVVDELRHCGIL
jgi:hypothetical protein